MLPAYLGFHGLLNRTSGMLLFLAVGFATVYDKTNAFADVTGGGFAMPVPSPLRAARHYAAVSNAGVPHHKAGKTATIILPVRSPLRGGRSIHTASDRPTPVPFRYFSGPTPNPPPENGDRLTAGQITAWLPDMNRHKSDKGEAVSAMIKIVNRGPEPVESVELKLIPFGMKIVSAGKSPAYGRHDKGQTLIRLENLKPGRAYWVPFSIQLKAIRDRGNYVSNSLKISLASQNSRRNKIRGTLRKSEDFSRLEWTVANCATNYYRELRTIYSQHGKLLKSMIPQTRTASRSLPTSWLFKPVFKTRNSVHIAGKASKSRKKLTARAGKRHKLLTSAGYQPNAQGRIADQNADRIVEQKIYRLALEVRKNRGIDPGLLKRGRYAWVTERVSTDLRRYLTQKPNPSICTGAIGIIDFFQSKMGRFRQRDGLVAELAKEAQHLRAKKRASLFRKSNQRIETDKVGRITNELIWLAGKVGYSKLLAKRLARTPDDWAALRLFRSATGVPRKRSKTRRKIRLNRKMRDLLSLTEASLYVEHVNAHYRLLNGSFKQVFRQIKDGHYNTCNCQN